MRRVRRTGRTLVSLASLGWATTTSFHHDCAHLQLGGVGLATLGTVFASAMFGALMAPVVSGAFSRFYSSSLINQSCHTYSSSPCLMLSSECSCLICNTPACQICAACRNKYPTQNLSYQSCRSGLSDMVTRFIWLKLLTVDSIVMLWDLTWKLIWKIWYDISKTFLRLVVQERSCSLECNKLRTSWFQLLLMTGVPSLSLPSYPGLIWPSQCTPLLGGGPSEPWNSPYSILRFLSFYF